MRIQRRTLPVRQTRRLSRATAKAAFTKCVEGRVCGQSCTIICHQCGSTSCQCSCSPYCPDAPEQLSCDPHKHPIERGIVPLVFEMKRLGLFYPCWSCEGHISKDGSLWKLPRVWFYCDSIVFVRLLADLIDSLKANAKLSVPWQVVVNFSDPDNPDTTFSLEPVPQIGDRSKLTSLQRDGDQIAKSLRFQISQQARLIQRRCGADFVRL